MKKIVVFSLIAILALSLCACSSEESAKIVEETEKELDWRDTIEYEGSFFVDETKKLLYALDIGSITLWDNAGDGTPLQIIEYDTAVPDAIERIEKEDFNGDGSCDIRIISGETEKGKTYRLWLWSSLSERYSECTLYASLVNPEMNEETGIIVSSKDTGIFGVVTRELVFNDTLGLDEISSTVNDPDKVAQTLADEICGGEVKLTDRIIWIDEVECAVYEAGSEAHPYGYLAFSADGKWYADDGCRGFYRALREEDGHAVLSSYAGDAGIAAKLAGTKGSGEITVMRLKEGFVEGRSACRYTVSTDELLVFVMVDSARVWYVSTDGGITYNKCDITTGANLTSDTYEFTLPEEEMELMGVGDNEKE